MSCRDYAATMIHTCRAPIFDMVIHYKAIINMNDKILHCVKIDL